MFIIIIIIIKPVGQAFCKKKGVIIEKRLFKRLAIKEIFKQKSFNFFWVYQKRENCGESC